MMATLGLVLALFLAALLLDTNDNDPGGFA